LFDVGTYAGLTDGQLLERFATRGGEAAELAFAALVDRHGPMVLRTCRSILRDDHEAHDAFQATFLVLVRKGRALSVRDSLGPWLHRVARRAAGKVRTQAARRRSQEKQLAERRLSHEDPRVPESDDRAAILHQEIDRLPERFRVPIVLCHLDGRTCEDVARSLGCPVGTVASRLARGRQQLRDRLTRRGLAPAAVALLASSEARGVLSIASSFPDQGTAGASPNAVRLARALLRSLTMDRVRSFATLLLVAAGLTLAAGLAYRAPAANPARPPAQEKPDDPPPREPLDRYKESVLSTVGTFRLIQVDGRESFQSREAILYKDGTARIWKVQEKAHPCLAVLTHEGAIRELNFLDEAGLLITTSDSSVKIWDGLTGKLRKELDGQVMRPLFLLQRVSTRRIATTDVAGETMTLWDVRRLEPVGKLRCEGSAHWLGAALSEDERTLATICDDRSVTLWDAATQKPLATLRAPSPPAVRVFPDDLETPSDKPTVRFDELFWESVRILLPAEPRTDAVRAKP
jgi:RNA polymerase sigma factor (sigma-70 family)